MFRIGDSSRSSSFPTSSPGKPARYPRSAPILLSAARALQASRAVHNITRTLPPYVEVCQFHPSARKGQLTIIHRPSARTPLNCPAYPRIPLSSPSTPPRRWMNPWGVSLLRTNCRRICVIPRCLLSNQPFEAPGSGLISTSRTRSPPSRLTATAFTCECTDSRLH